MKETQLTEHCTVSVNDGGDSRSLTAWCRRVGGDYVVVVGGGEQPHVGCVVLAIPHASERIPGRLSASCSVLTVSRHKEEPIARRVAERVAEATGCTVVVTAGIHDDGLDRSGIESYLRLGERLAEEIVMTISKAFGDTD